MKKYILVMSLIVGLSQVSVVFSDSPSDHSENSKIKRVYKCGIIKGLLFSPQMISQAIERSLTEDLRFGTCSLAYYHGLLRSAIEGGRGLQSALSQLADSSVFDGDDAEDELEELSDDIQDELDRAEEHLKKGNEFSVGSTLGNLATFFSDDVNEELERIAQEFCE